MLKVLSTRFSFSGRAGQLSRRKSKSINSRHAEQPSIEVNRRCELAFNWQRGYLSAEFEVASMDYRLREGQERRRIVVPSQRPAHATFIRDVAAFVP